jgi:hypothetical protein
MVAYGPQKLGNRKKRHLKNIFSLKSLTVQTLLPKTNKKLLVVINKYYNTQILHFWVGICYISKSMHLKDIVLPKKRGV